MKKIIIFISYIFITFSIFAQNYYEIPYVGKRSKLTKLSTDEENKFIKENSVQRIYNSFFTENDDNILSNFLIPAELTNIYKEEIPDENGNYRLVVYRAMYFLKETTKSNLIENDDTERKCMGQIIYVPLDGKYKQYEKFIYYGNELFLFGRMSSIGVEANNVQFRICGDNLFSFYTRLVYDRWSHGYDEETLRFETDRYTENMIYRSKISDVMEKTQICEVKVDFPLIDKNNPFKYSAQNAYDGDSSTSYVEDTEDDLFEIEFLHYNYHSNFVDDWFTKFKVINGYASTSDLYSNNNRIKEFIVENENENGDFEILSRFNCKDNTMDYQFFDLEPNLYYFGLTVNKIYKGIKYDDTALAEIDFYGKKNGWFFEGGE